VAAISEERGAELDAIYGTADGIDSALEQFRYAGAGDADVSIRGAQVEGTRAGTMRRRSEHILFWIGNGTAVVTPAGAGPIAIPPGRPFLLSGSVEYAFTADTSRVTLLHLSDRVLRSVLAARDARVRGPLVFVEEAEDDEALRRLRAVLQRDNAALTDAGTAPGERAELNRRIAETVVDAFALRENGRVASSTVARACAFVREHAQEDIGVDDIAAACGLSARGLQNAFAKHLGTTPTQYLREARLDGANQELAADETTSVGDVARRWRFQHQGRFSATYADRFGESPSATLRRTRAAAEG
jgi:AraC-like DNA-binding protein